MKNSLGLKMGPNFITADTFLLSFDIGTFFNPRVESRGATVPAKPKLYESPINRIVQKKNYTSKDSNNIPFNNYRTSFSVSV